MTPPPIRKDLPLCVPQLMMGFTADGQRGSCNGIAPAVTVNASPGGFGSRIQPIDGNGSPRHLGHAEANTWSQCVRLFMS